MCVTSMHAAYHAYQVVYGEKVGSLIASCVLAIIIFWLGVMIMFPPPSFPPPDAYTRLPLAAVRNNGVPSPSLLVL